jgi:hypothetical protein
MATENRRYPRVDISWPVIVVTDDSIITGTTENLSLGGTLIKCSVIPLLYYNFRAVFKPSKGRFILATVEGVWSRPHVDTKSICHELGMRFTFIPDWDYQQISEAISSRTY